MHFKKNYDNSQFFHTKQNKSEFIFQISDSLFIRQKLRNKPIQSFMKHFFICFLNFSQQIAFPRKNSFAPQFNKTFRLIFFSVFLMFACRIWFLFDPESIDLSKQFHVKNLLTSFLCSPMQHLNFALLFFVFRRFAAAANIENVHKIKFAQLKVLNEAKKVRKEYKKKSFSLTRKINLNEAKYFYLVKHATRRLIPTSKRANNQAISTYLHGKSTCAGAFSPRWPHNRFLNSC